MKPNAFTAKPDVKAFVKKANHALNSSKVGQKAAANPTTEQRFFMEIDHPPKNDTRPR